MFSSLHDRCEHRFIATSDEKPLRFLPLSGVCLRGLCSGLGLLFTTQGFLPQKGERAAADPRTLHPCNVGNYNQTQTCLPTETKGCGGPSRGDPYSPAPAWQEAARTPP